MLDPGLLLVVDDLLETEISNSLLVLVDLLLILKVEQPVLGNNDITINIDSILLVVVVFRRLILHAQVLAGVLMEPSIIVVILLLHKTLLDDNCEDVRDHTN